MTLLADMTLSEYRERQLLLIEGLLERYILGEISLKQLVDSLEGLFFSMQSIDIEWESEAPGVGVIIELIYVIALIKNESIDPKDFNAQEYLRRLKHLSKY